VTDKLQDVTKNLAVPASAAAPANPRPSSAATTPLPAVQGEMLHRRLVAAVPASTPELPIGKTESTESTVTRARMSDAKVGEQLAAGEAVLLAKARKEAALSRYVVKSDAEAEKSTAEAKFKVNDGLKRAELSTMAGAGGVGGGASLAATGATADVAQTRQQFLQLDNQSRYRKNFNSPPLPQVLQDFAFERTGDRVRIVDTDGSTYEGTVMPASAEELRMKGVSQLEGAKERKDISGQQAQPVGAPTVDAQSAYRFYANGVNLKLKQSVEFRGEWQPTTQAQSSPVAVKSALQPVTFSGVLSERLAAEKKEQSSSSNSLSGPAPTALNFNYQQSQKVQNELSPGRISGRAIVGGKNEFDINAVPK
jgi:hypothetical protein